MPNTLHKPGREPSKSQLDGVTAAKTAAAAAVLSRLNNLPAQANVYLPTRQVRARYNVSDMTVWRWQHDPELDFPKPILIQRRKFWKLAELEAWEATQPAELDDARKKKIAANMPKVAS